MTGQQVIYPQSGNCIVFDKRQNRVDSSFSQHDDTISAVCTSSSRQLVASGDTSTIHIWDVHTCTEVTRLPASDSNTHQQGNISVLSFSPDDTKLVSIGYNGQQQTICVWMTHSGDWSDCHHGMSTLAGHDKIHFAVFSSNQSHLITGGSRHINFWTEEHSTLQLSKGVLSEKYINETFMCGVLVEESLITGASDGSLVIWEGKKIVRDVQAHDNCITSLCSCPEGFISGCENGSVILWSVNLHKITAFDMSSLSPICSLDMYPNTNGKSTNTILVRGESGGILEVSVVSGCVSLLCRGSTSEVPTVGDRPE